MILITSYFNCIGGFMLASKAPESFFYLNSTKAMQFFKCPTSPLGGASGSERLKFHRVIVAPSTDRNFVERLL